MTNQIKENIYAASQNADISIVEIGGTVGDIEGQPYLEAIRQIRFELGQQNVLFVHLTLVPFIKAAKELKTKPTQHSVKELRTMGIQPDVLCLRADREVPYELRKKIAHTCNVDEQSVINLEDVDSIYKVPLHLHNQSLDQIVVDRLNIWTGAPDLSTWRKISETIDDPKFKSKIGVVGKYVDVADSYKSINEALIHAGIYNESRVDVELVDSETIHEGNAEELLKDFDGVVVPGGFGDRGIDGKIAAINYARRNNIPFLGICLGMQLAAVEFARHKLGMEKAGSLEMNPDSSDFIITLLDDQKNVTDKGGTMRLGAYPCHLQKDTRSHTAYRRDSISERHRHRFEFNNEYREKFEEHGVCFSGLSPDSKLVEIMELRDHPWFVSCQFHPELKSSPMEPHPLFRDFVGAALKTTGVPVG